MLPLVARLALAAVFAVAGVAKLLDREGTRESLGQFGLPSRLTPGAAFVLPAVELVAAGLLVPAATARAGALLALALLLVFLVASGRSLARGEQPDCNCFGAIHSKPIGRRTLVRNLGLGAVAAALVATGPHFAKTAARGLSVLVQEDRETIFAFSVGAIPAAVIVDREGRIASPTAMGPDAVEELLLGQGTLPEPDVIESVGGVR